MDVCIHVRLCMYVCMYVCIHVRLCMYVSMYVCMYVWYVYVHIYIHTCVHKYIHAYIHDAEWLLYVMNLRQQQARALSKLSVVSGR